MTLNPSEQRKLELYLNAYADFCNILRKRAGEEPLKPDDIFGGLQDTQRIALFQGLMKFMELNKRPS